VTETTRLTLYDAARMTGLPPAALHALVRASVIPGIRHGTALVISEPDLSRWARTWVRILGSVAERAE
jgi:hypothetical protein